jgi:prevent-host-death family protein
MGTMTIVTIVVITEVCKMAKWAVAEAKAKFSEVVEGTKNGPQEITKNGRSVAVLISMEDWKAEYGTHAPKGSLAEFLQKAPLRGSGIKLNRVRLDPRHIDF